MTPGIGLMKRRLEKEKDAIALGVSAIAKKYNVKPEILKTLETKYHDDAGECYGWSEQYSNREICHCQRWSAK